MVRLPLSCPIVLINCGAGSDRKGRNRKEGMFGIICWQFGFGGDVIWWFLLRIKRCWMNFYFTIIYYYFILI